MKKQYKNRDNTSTTNKQSCCSISAPAECITYRKESREIPAVVTRR